MRVPVWNGSRRRLPGLLRTVQARPLRAPMRVSRGSAPEGRHRVEPRVYLVPTRDALGRQLSYHVTAEHRRESDPSFESNTSSTVALEWREHNWRSQVLAGSCSSNRRERRVRVPVASGAITAGVDERKVLPTHDCQVCNLEQPLKSGSDIVPRDCATRRPQSWASKMEMPDSS
jgi:hypothetical protein